MIKRGSNTRWLSIKGVQTKTFLPWWKDGGTIFPSWQDRAVEVDQTPKHNLDLIRESHQQGSLIAQREGMIPRAAGIAISILVGIGFILLIERGWPAVIVMPIVFLILFLGYKRSGAQPSFWPQKGTLHRTKREFLFGPVEMIYLALGFFVIIFLFPSLIFKALELNDSGYAWAPYLGGVLVTINVLIILECDRFFLRKKLEAIDK